MGVHLVVPPNFKVLPVLKVEGSQVAMKHYEVVGGALFEPHFQCNMNIGN